MSDNAGILGGIGITALVVLGLIGAVTYGCQRVNQAYFAEMHACIDRGGTFIPHGNFEAVCVQLQGAAHE